MTKNHCILKCILFLGIINLLNNTLCIGQSPGYRNFSVKDGLPSSEVYSSIQDSKGFMWFSTDRGVCRFDGYDFKTFTTSDGLADNTIFECQEDYKGRIWFRSLSGKLSYFYNDSIYRLSINDSLTKLVKTAFTESMVIDTTDNIYMGLYGFTQGVISINLRKKTISIIKIPEGTSYVLLLSKKMAINGYTGNPRYRPTIEGPLESGIYIYALGPGDSTVRQVKKRDWEMPRNILIHDKVILLPDHKIAVSVNTDFIILDTTSARFIYYKRYGNDITNISCNKEHGIWVSTEHSLEYIINGNVVNIHTPSLIKNNHVTSVTTDYEGGTWFTTLYGGVYYSASLEFKTYSTDNGLPGNKIAAITVEKNGTIWTASERNNKIAVIQNDSIIFHLLPNSDGLSVNSILLRDNNEVWISNSSLKGLLIYKNNKTFDLLASCINGFACLIPDTGGFCWATGYRMLFSMKRSGRDIVSSKFITLDSKVFSLCKCQDGAFYIATLKGLWGYKNDSLINYGDKYNILKNRIDDIIEAGDSSLWIATKDTGVIIMKGNKLTHITSKEGLLSNFCQCLCTDYKGNIWVGTNKGISHLFLSKDHSHTKIDTIINLSSQNLIEVNKIVILKDSVYAATSNGLTVFNMNNVSYNKVSPPVYITGIKINNKNWPVTSTLKLYYDENYFFISFVGLTYKDAGNVQYRYKMEGIDTGWIYTRNRDVQYPKLAPGNYKFLVSAMNNDGKWNQIPAAIQLNISPPFWATWWFRSLIIIVIAGFIYWRFKVVENRGKRDAEINKQLITMELKELKAQMDPHFLFNNLNTLTHLVELKSDDAPEFVEELSKYYRYSLQFRNSEFTALENELKQAVRYIHILKIRFGDNMKIDWKVDEPLKSYYVATYSLQLLLENITKHNIVSASKPVWVEIETTDRNTLVVKNQLQSKNSGSLSNGHGLKSINQRYELLTKKKVIVSQTSQYFSVELPLITPQEYESTVS